VGQGLTLDGQTFTIVGVVPASFKLQVLSFRPSDVYAPIGQWTNPILNFRTAGLGFHGVGRLKAGVTIQQARADMKRVTADLTAAYPDANTGIGATIMPLKEEMVGSLRPLLLVLLAAVGFCAPDRLRERGQLAYGPLDGENTRIRGARRARRSPRKNRSPVADGKHVVGPGWRRLGLLLASWGTKLALQNLPATLPRANEIGLDVRVLLFTMGASLLCGILFGLVPAL